MSGSTRSSDDAGAVMVAVPVSERLAAAASTQFDRATIAGDELRIETPDVAEAALAALEVRSWSEALDPDRLPVITVTRAGEAAGASESSDEPASGAAEGEISIHPELAAELDFDWLAARNGRKHPSSLTWARSGRGPGHAPDGVTGPRMPSPPMLGRRSEMVDFASSWARVSGGESRTLLIAGTPGAGKTRLVAEAADEILRAGGRVLYGGAEERATTPYAPFVEALSGRKRARGDKAVPFADLAAGVARDLPVSAGLGNERSTLFSAAVGELERYCEESPTALVIDDLHACDRSSLELFGHLASSPDLPRLLLVGSYRSTEVEPDSALAGLLNQLGEATSTDRIELGGLAVTPLRGLAASFGVDEPDATALGKLALEEADGLPIYACELIRSRIGGEQGETHADLPPSLHMLITARADFLGEQARTHLQTASLTGGSFDPAVVRAACEASAEEFEASMRKAESARLVHRGPDPDRYTFEHALTRRYLAEELSPERRGEIHRRLAEAMERLQAKAGAGAIEAGRIAYHWERTHPPELERAAAQSRLAAEAALARFDPDAAAEWYEQVLELGKREQAEDEAGRCDLLTGYGTALRMAGDARFREILLEAARIALDLDDTDRLVAAVLTNDRGFTSAIGEFDTERLAMLELAVERVTDLPRRALVLAQLAIELTFSPERERRYELASEALELAEEAGDPQLLARVLNRHLIARWEPGNARERIRTADRGIEIGARLGDSLDFFHGLHWRAGAQLEACEVDAARRSLERERSLASRLGDPTATWLAECSHSVHLALGGELAQAEASAERALRLGSASAQPDVLPFYATQIASIRWQQGRLGELAELLDQAIEGHPGLPAFRSLVALARAEAGNHDGALEMIASDSRVNFERLPRDPTWLNGVVTYAHAVADVGDIDAAEMLFDLLEPVRGQIATASTSAWGTTDHALGRLASTLGAHDSAAVYLERALSEYTRMRAPVWRGQAALDLGIALRVAGRDRTREAELIDEARGTALRHEAKLLMRELPPRGSAREDSEDGRTRGRGGGRSRRRGESVSERLGALDLTDRQRDVVALVVRGLSNKQVAAELEISPATVKRHLEEAFRRAGVPGRKGLMAVLNR